MSVVKNAVEAAAPNFSLENVYKELRKRGIKNPEHPSFASTINDYLIPARREYQNSKVQTRVLTR